jgi:hypothetical protein
LLEKTGEALNKNYDSSRWILTGIKTCIPLRSQFQISVFIVAICFGLSLVLFVHILHMICVCIAATDILKVSCVNCKVRKRRLRFNSWSSGVTPNWAYNVSKLGERANTRVVTQPGRYVDSGAHVAT